MPPKVPPFGDFIPNLPFLSSATNKPCRAMEREGPGEGESGRKREQKREGKGEGDGQSNRNRGEEGERGRKQGRSVSLRK